MSLIWTSYHSWSWSELPAVRGHASLTRFLSIWQHIKLEFELVKAGLHIKCKFSKVLGWQIIIWCIQKDLWGSWIWTSELRYIENTKSQSMSLQTSQLSIRLVQLPSWIIILTEGEDTGKAWQKDWLTIDSFLQLFREIRLIFSPFILDIHVLMFWMPCNCEKKEESAAFISLEFIYILPQDNVHEIIGARL